VEKQPHASKPKSPAATDLNATTEHVPTEGGAQAPADPTATAAHGEPDPTQVAGGTASWQPLDQTAAAPAASGTNLEAKPKKVTCLGEFRLVAKLGEGGMGTVYKARQNKLDRDVAVKVPFKHLTKDPAFVQRFEREARIMARLDHPNILRCYSVGEEYGLHYLAMEFIDGASMESWMTKLGKLTIGDALHVILACAHALQHAHELDLIHRDMKPDNVLLTSKGVIKVADLGLAKAVTDDVSLSRTGQGAGTPVYMSLEQARDAKHVDGRSDIYSLGIMLYRFVTGELPFAGSTVLEFLTVKEKAKFLPARRFNAEIPERLDLIIDKMMAKEPNHRYQSCAELIKALEGLGLANPTLSFIPGATGQVGKLPSGAGPASKPSGLAPRTVPQLGATAVATPAAPQPKEPEAADYWFVRFRGPDAHKVTRKLTTDQVLEMIKHQHFESRTKACRTLTGKYQPLGTFREFGQILRGIEAKAAADRKADLFRAMYKKIEKEQRSWERWRAIRNYIQGLGSWFTFLVWMAILAGVGFAFYKLLWPPLLEWFTAIHNKITS
jgi:serine/threonine-protein kinase